MPGKAIIAIVDDDHSVREALTSLVRSLGYVAMPVGCAQDLLNSKHRRSVSYLIADLRMPGMTGLELHDRLVARSLDGTTDAEEAITWMAYLNA